MVKTSQKCENPQGAPPWKLGERNGGWTEYGRRRCGWVISNLPALITKLPL